MLYILLAIGSLIIGFICHARRHFSRLIPSYRVDEQYGPFPRDSVHSPCMRATKGERLARTTFMCPQWGYAVARFRYRTSAR